MNHYGICKRCAHNKTCVTPCGPVEDWLKFDNKGVFEKHYSDKIVVFPLSREINESNLHQKHTGEESQTAIDAFSTESENPFACFDPKLKQTGILIDRFFYKWSYTDLAEKYGITENDAIKIYHYSQKRLLEVLEALDGKQELRNVDHWRHCVTERSGKLTKGVRYYLMNKVFGLRPSEITEIEGLDKSSSSVRQLIARTHDQLISGKISLINVSLEEREAARKRLESKNAKRRERYNSQKLSNFADE